MLTIMPAADLRRLTTAFGRDSVGRTALIFALLGAALYSASWAGGFIWDDRTIYIVRNALLRLPDGLYRFWFTLEPADYYPLTYTTFWLEWRLSGEDTRLYHTTNILLHALCGAVLFQLLRRLKFRSAWLISVLFIVHPLQVESVAWISQRKTILCALLGFASALDYLGYLESGNRRVYVRSMLWFVLSLAAKPTLVTLPILYTVVELWRADSKERWGAKVLTETARRVALPFALSLAFGVVGLLFQQKAMGGIDVRGQEPLARLASLGWAAWFYVLRMVRVWDLCFVYPRWQVDASNLLVWLPNLAVLATFAALWRARFRVGVWPCAAWVVYLVTMLPSLGIADVFFWRYSYVGDHYVYQSLPALLILIVEPLTRWLEKTRHPQRWITVAALALAIPLGVTTHRRAGVFQSEEQLWRDTLQINPGAALAWANLGAGQMRTGELNEAEASILRALAIDPSLFEAWTNLGDLQRTAGHWRDAAKSYGNVLERAPIGTLHRRMAFAGLSAALSQLGSPREAIEANDVAMRELSAAVHAPSCNDDSRTLARALVYRLVTCVNLGDATAADTAGVALRALLEAAPCLHRDVAVASREMGRHDVALKHWDDSVRNSPNDGELLFEAALSADSMGDLNRAIKYFEAASLLRPNDVGIATRLGMTWLKKGKLESAVESFRRATQLAPTDGRLWSNLALALATGGQHADAAAAFRRATELNPDDASALRDLAWILATTSLADTPDNVREARRVAERACELTERLRPEPLDALAAAYAAAHDFDAAARTIAAALEVAHRAGSPDELVRAYQQRQASYSERRVYRQEVEIAP
ncbi:MAG: tetratricopeptide repeat protein [Pirellulales bacterium]